MNLDEQFFKSVGLAEASDEQKAKLVDQLSETVQNRVALRLAELVPEDKLTHFDDLIEKGKEDEAFDYLETAYPDYNDLVQQEITAAKEELVKNLTEIVDELKSEKAS